MTSVKERAIEQYKQLSSNNSPEDDSYRKIRLKRRKKSIMTLISLFFVMLIAASLLLVGLNFAGLYDKLEGLIVKDIQLTPEESVEKDKNDRADAKLEQISLVQKSLNEYENSLKKLEIELAAKSDALEKKQVEIDAMRELLSQKTTEVNHLISIYKNMNAASAADILAKTSDTDMSLLILKNLGAEDSAKILALMPSDRADYYTKRLYPE